MSIPTTRRLVALTATAVTVIGTGVATAAAATAAARPSATATTVLSGDVLPGLSHDKDLGATASGHRVEVGITLARPHAAAEAAFERALYTKGTPQYHHFLTPAQFDARFGVPQSDYSTVRSWATRQGMHVETAVGSHDYLVVGGTAAQAERTFSVRLHNFASPSSGHFFANVNPPTVPAGVRVSGVIGLNSKLRSHTFATTPSEAVAEARAHGIRPQSVRPDQDTCVSSVCTGLTTPQDLWSTYDQPTNNYGQGQQMAVLGEGQTGTVISNLRSFETLHGLPPIPIRVDYTEGSEGTDNTGEVEWDLDTQSSTGMSPEAYGETLYFAHDLTDASVEADFSTWADDPTGPLQANASFGECEENLGNPEGASAAFTAESEASFSKAVMEGRTLFASTGDTGSSCPVLPVDVNGVANEAVPDTEYPASSPNVVAVGGTVLYTDGTGASQTGLTPSGAKRVDEYSWNYTGGGTSFTFAKPSYQNGIATITGYCVDDPSGNPVTPGTVPCRGLPDVAAQSGDVATNGYGIVAQGETNYPGGGTSLSSPLNMGMWTRIQAAAPGKQSGSTVTYPGLGFANATYYPDWKAHATDFFDVGGTSGTTHPSSNGYYASTPGWDYLSGLGVPDVSAIAKDVVGSTAPANPELPTYTTSGPNLAPCSATLFTDPAGDDAYIGDPSGGSNPQLDILSGNITYAGGVLHTTLTLNNLSKNPAQTAQGAANDYYLLWTYNGTQYFSEAEVDTTTGAVTYGDGTVAGNQFTTNNTDTGSFNPGKNGTVVVNVPVANVGNPAGGALLLAPGGQTRVLVGTTTSGGFIEEADAGGPNYDYKLGQRCVPTYTVKHIITDASHRGVVITVKDAAGGGGIRSIGRQTLVNAADSLSGKAITFNPAKSSYQIKAAATNNAKSASISFVVTNTAGHTTTVTTAI